MSDTDELKGMIMTFRVSELQMLLGFASQNKTGRKTELQGRAIGLLKNKSVPCLTQLHSKIRQLYKTIQQGVSVQQNSEPPLHSVPPPARTPLLASSTPCVPPPHSTPASSVPPPNSYMALPQTRPPVFGSMYGYQQGKVPPVNSYPVHPDVRIKRLPFYDILSEIIKPSSLSAALSATSSTSRSNESNFMFCLTPQQATEIASNRECTMGKSEYPVQVQLRFCLQESSCEQDDLFPPGIAVKINGKMAQLPNPIPTNRPGVEPKRPPRPVNVSSYVKLCPAVANHIMVSWTPDYTRGYVIAAYLVRKLSATDLLNRLKAKGIRHSDFTSGLIKEKLAEDKDCEIATTSLRVSLLCPLGKMRMKLPARSSMCSHLQCFDAFLFLQMNEKRPTWSCPVCDKSISFESLVIDGYFNEILSNGSLPSTEHDIQLHKDGTWSCNSVNGDEMKSSESSTKSPLRNAEVEEILDDSDIMNCEPESTVTSTTNSSAPVINIDLTASDSEDDTPTSNQQQPVQTSSASIKQQDHIVSDSSNSSSIGEGCSSIILLDSPSPPPPPVSPLPQTNNNSAPNKYPQIIPSSRPLVMNFRMPTDQGRYHPF